MYWSDVLPWASTTPLLTFTGFRPASRIARSEAAPPGRSIAHFSHVPLVSSYHLEGLGTPAVFKDAAGSAARVTARGNPVLDGHDGAALFVPFGDIPLYDAVRQWLHAFCKHAVERHTGLLTDAADEAERDNPVHLREDERGGDFQRAAVLAGGKSRARNGDAG
jgi:hypothetical protein